MVFLLAVCLLQGKKVLILFQNGNILYCFLFNMEICDHNLWLKNTMYLRFLSENMVLFVIVYTFIWIPWFCFPLHIHLLIFLFQFTAVVGHCTISLGKWSLTFHYIMMSSLTLRRLMSYIYIYGAPILDVSRSHTTTQHSR